MLQYVHTIPTHNNSKIDTIPSRTQQSHQISRTKANFKNIIQETSYFQLSRMNFAETNMICAWVKEPNAMKVSHASLGINPWRNDFDSARNLQEHLTFLFSQRPSVFLNCVN